MFNVRGEAVKLVKKVLFDGAYTNILLNQFLQKNSFDDRDRRFLTQLVYGTVKVSGTLNWYLKKLVRVPLIKLEPFVLVDLQVALFQVLFLEKVPVSAAVNEAVELAKEFANLGAAKMVNGVLRNFLRKKDEFIFPNDEAEQIAIKYWHPKFLVKKWLKYYGKENTIKICEFNNAPALITLRVNALRSTRDDLLNEFEKLGMDAAKGEICEDAIILNNFSSLDVLYKNFLGKFYIQDESSMLVARMFAPQKGQKILDLCAAPGGKTTHLAELMHNNGEIFACDIHSHKLNLINVNAQNLGISIIKTLLNDATILNENFVDKFDGVLVDVPCSGLGVLRRRVELRWRRDRENLKIFPPLQKTILETASKYVKKNGTLLYSTCTIEQSENHYVVEDFLTKHPEYILQEERQLLPYIDHVDGFYMAKMQRIK